MTHYFVINYCTSLLIVLFYHTSILYPFLHTAAFYLLNSFPLLYLLVSQSCPRSSAATVGQRGPLWGCWGGTDRFHLQRANG